MYLVGSIFPYVLHGARVFQPKFGCNCAPNNLSQECLLRHGDSRSTVGPLFQSFAALFAVFPCNALHMTVFPSYLHQPTAVEVFFSSTAAFRSSDWTEVSRRSSVLFHFPSDVSTDQQQHHHPSSPTPQPTSAASICRSFYNALKSLCARDQLSVCYMTNARDAFASAGIHKKWLAGQVSNFDYIMALNTFSGRSFNDLRQYPVRGSMECPMIIIYTQRSIASTNHFISFCSLVRLPLQVFPWVLSEYAGDTLDLSNPNNYRCDVVAWVIKPTFCILTQKAETFPSP